MRSCILCALVQALEDEEADQEFWGQEFFKEEEREADWEKSGSEATDVPDSDFDQSVRGLLHNAFAGTPWSGTCQPCSSLTLGISLISTCHFDVSVPGPPPG